MNKHDVASHVHVFWWWRRKHTDLVIAKWACRPSPCPTSEMPGVVGDAWADAGQPSSIGDTSADSSSASDLIFSIMENPYILKQSLSWSARARRSSDRTKQEEFETRLKTREVAPTSSWDPGWVCGSWGLLNSYPNFITSLLWPFCPSILPCIEKVIREPPLGLWILNELLCARSFRQHTSWLKLWYGPFFSLLMDNWRKMPLSFGDWYPPQPSLQVNWDNKKVLHQGPFIDDMEASSWNHLSMFLQPKQAACQA